MGDTFTYLCAQCGEEYDSDYPDEDARAEAIANGYDPDDESTVVICDDCWQALTS